MKKSIVAILAAVAILAGCATGPVYTEMKSTIPALAADKGRVYFYRPSTVGAAMTPTVTLNGKSVGTSKSHGFFYVDVAPGDYKVTIDSDATFTLAAQETKYIREVVQFGFTYHIAPVLVTSDIAAPELEDMHYSPDNGE